MQLFYILRECVEFFFQVIYFFAFKLQLGANLVFLFHPIILLHIEFYEDILSENTIDYHSWPRKRHKFGINEIIKLIFVSWWLLWFVANAFCIWKSEKAIYTILEPCYTAASNFYRENE